MSFSVLPQLESTSLIRFIVDAQLPKRLTYQLREAGYDAIHTLDLPAANRTADESINTLSLREERVVITKDTGFRDSFLLHGRPHKLLLITTGNCSNTALLDLLTQHLPAINSAFLQSSFLESGQTHEGASRRFGE